MRALRCVVRQVKEGIRNGERERDIEAGLGRMREDRIGRRRS